MESQNEKLNSISNWLMQCYNSLEVVDELYLIGSIMTKHFDQINDIDIVQLVKYCSKNDLKIYESKLKRIRTDFFSQYNKSLHVTTFTQNEKYEFRKFMNINESIKIK
jgi:hypothetical protein